MSLLHEHRLFPSDPVTRAVAARLYQGVQNLPIVSPHGHTQASWFARNTPFPDPAALFVQPDHYITRMLYSQGVALEELGLEKDAHCDPRDVWRLFATHYFLFRGTPTRLWLDYAFEKLFRITERLTAETADWYFDKISDCLQQPEFRPRALFERFRIEVLATTDSPLDMLEDHLSIRRSDWPGRILPTFRPDPVVDPDFAGFQSNLKQLAVLHGKDISNWKTYLDALRRQRERFRQCGATATDHGHPTAQTADLGAAEAEALFQVISAGGGSPAERELFRAQVLTEMARMSLEDGLVMQVHPGSFRNHNQSVFARFGRDMGADLPVRTDFVHALKPLLDLFGNEPQFRLILFTLDESTYSRELAPLAGHYPCLRLGPPWWFHDSPEGMLRFRQETTETAGFYNTVGFNDDTRAFLSIPGRHDCARRMDCAYLATLVAEHRLDEDEAAEVAYTLTYGLVREAYRLT